MINEGQLRSDGLLPQEDAWAPCVLDGWRGSPIEKRVEDWGQTWAHVLLTMRDGLAEVTLDGQQYRIGPGQVLLAQPGEDLSWSLPQNSYAEVIIFDCAHRRRQRVEPGQRLDPVEMVPGRCLESYLGHRIGPVLLEQHAQQARETIRLLGDCGGVRCLTVCWLMLAWPPYWPNGPWMTYHKPKISGRP